MNRLICAMVAPLAASLVAGCTPEDPFSGSRPLLCTPAQIFQCTRAENCVTVAAEDVGAPDYFLLDVAAGLLVTTRASAERRESSIERMKRVGDVLFVQGIEDGRADQPDGVGWSISLNDDDGSMAASVVTDGAAIMFLGACVPTE
jgi:hypothetical protein